MLYDLHIHHRNMRASSAVLIERMKAAGIDGGVALSQSPIAALEDEDMVLSAAERIKNVMAFVKGQDSLYPFYFIDPTEPDAADQVDMALDAGISGFKTICTHFYPSDQRAVEIYHKVAEAGKPYLFHSGILYDGNNASGNYNRPCEFEVLLSVPRLRFALAHISWPWCDECIAVYGKFHHYLERFGSDDSPLMYVDTTPGTPPLYRKEALKKLLAMPGAEDYILWGTDCSTDYSTKYAQSIRERDLGIGNQLGLRNAVINKWHHRNFVRFLSGKAE